MCPVPTPINGTKEKAKQRPSFSSMTEEVFLEAGLSLVIVCVDLPIVVLALNTKGFFAVAATFPHCI